MLRRCLDDIDDHFLKASESAHEVSKMLEATRMHYHSNFADNRGHIDHSARVMRAITWNRSCKGMKDENDGKDDFDNEELETHATILDKMLAWEKKLYKSDAGELMKIEYQRKVALLSKQKKRGSSHETLEKTKAAVSHLHTRYIVDMQSMDSTVSEINRLRDKQLYPKLVALVDGMATMWEKMFMHHSSQLKIALLLRNLDISLSPKETSEQHHETTRQLYSILREWHAQFQGLMKHQREYIQALNSWLKLNLIPIESNLRERVSSPPRVIRPQIQPLLQAWNDLLEKLPDDRPRGIIHTFAEVVHTIIIIQDDELKLKEKCDETRREYIRRSRAFDDWYRKHSEKKAAAAAAGCASIPRRMDWPLIKDQDEVVLGTLPFQGVHTVGYNRLVTALRPGLFAKEYLVGEVASPANTFVKKFMAKKGEPIDALAVEVIYPAVLLAHGRPVSLLTAMVDCLQNGLRELALDFTDVTEVESGGNKAFKTPNPRVPLPYTYLMAWYVLHCPPLMSASSPPGDSFTPFVQRLESAKWEGGCTRAIFRLPHKTPNSYTSMSFCNWYFAASRTPNYNLNTSCLKDIRHMYASRRGSKTSRLRGIDEFLSVENQPAGQEEEQGAEPVLGEEQQVVDSPMTRAAGKRKLSADEAGLYNKQIRRK
ncbi:uncharacterized protein LOC109831165 [Asparagus officinalis]|uniref:uncharacterized protein LOC109831165 n=1 Tax=Asparagus officinalis TaxID=4686 RepID=UPI00098DF613|nr:uncharacterized protein LOC109831165 [Asparagus officinalis]